MTARKYPVLVEGHSYRVTFTNQTERPGNPAGHESVYDFTVNSADRDWTPRAIIMWVNRWTRNGRNTAVIVDHECARCAEVA